MSGSLSRNILITMSDENKFISEDENNVRSNLEEEREVAKFEQENVDRPQTEESYEMVSVGSEDRMEDEAAAESYKQRIEEQIEEVRIDNETLNQDKLEGPQSSLEKVPSKKRKARKSTGRSTGTKSKEKPELIKQEDKATETFLFRSKLNEQKLDKIMSTIRPIEKHIHSTDKQAQLSKQIQLQIKQLQTQVKQIERISKNIWIEISRRANKEKSFKAPKKTVERTAPSKSKQSNKARSKKNSKIDKRK
jgi:hypothetical protein